MVLILDGNSEHVAHAWIKIWKKYDCDWSLILKTREWLVRSGKIWKEKISEKMTFEVETTRKLVLCVQKVVTHVIL